MKGAERKPLKRRAHALHALVETADVGEEAAAQAHVIQTLGQERADGELLKLTGRARIRGDELLKATGKLTFSSLSARNTPTVSC